MFAISIPRGNTATKTATVTDALGAAFDMTSYVLKLIVKAKYGDADAAAVLNKDFTFSTPATGIGTMDFTHTNTNIQAGTYVAELKLYKPDGTFIRTLDLGTLTITEVALLEIPVLP